MASLCETQQCTTDRRGFRQELESWRHKLIRCLNARSILEGPTGPALLEDLKHFREYEAVAVSDWPFNDSCSYCHLRRDKVKETLLGLKKNRLGCGPRHLLVKDQIAIGKFEKQTEEFLNAVLRRKDVPSISDRRILVVAGNILQRMINHFTAEYTSKTSCSQDIRLDSMHHPDQNSHGQSLLSGVISATGPAAMAPAPALNQNPVLSKLLMPDQDAPLDLTIKKPQAECCDQDGVLDLSLKKKHYNSSLPVHTPCLSPTLSTMKRESPDFHLAKPKDFRSFSILKQFMAKLCLHHQQQVVDAIGFLQMEVKAPPAAPQKDTNLSSSIHGTPTTTWPNRVRPNSEVPLPLQSTPKTGSHKVPPSIPNSYAIGKILEKTMSMKTTPKSDSLLGTNQSLITPITISRNGENSSQSDHVPLKMKILTKNASGKKVSCVLNATLSSHVDGTQEHHCNSNPSSKAETQSARLSSSVRKHGQMSLMHQPNKREDVGLIKDAQTKLFSVHMTIPSDTARTARKTIRTASDHPARESVRKAVVDPDLGHYDIVFIDKPITECFKEKPHGLLPRRNARKSTRGHTYSDEIWELKTVRTLAGRGNELNSMPELISLIAPQEKLSKPQSVPHVEMPIAGTCSEIVVQQTPTEKSPDESAQAGPEDGAEATVTVDNDVVETTQTEKSESQVQSELPAPPECSVENNKVAVNADVAQEATVGLDAGIETTNVNHPPVPAEVNVDPTELCQVVDQTMEQIAEPEEGLVMQMNKDDNELKPSSDEQLNDESTVPEQSSDPPTVTSSENRQDNVEERINVQECQSLQPETKTQGGDPEVPEEVTAPESVEEPTDKTGTNPPDKIDNIQLLEMKDKDVNEVPQKTADTPQKDSLSSRKKRSSRYTQLPDQSTQSDLVIVGYVNCRPVLSSDRSLRHRPNSNLTSPCYNSAKTNKPNVSNNSLTFSKRDSEEDQKKSEICSSEASTPIKPPKTPLVQQATETPAETPALSLRSKQSHKPKATQRNSDAAPAPADQPVDQTQSIESTRQLRSASQKQSATPASHPTSNRVGTISPSKVSMLMLPPADQRPSLTLPDSLPATTSAVTKLHELSTTQQPQQYAAQDKTETRTELSNEGSPTDKAPGDLPSNELEPTAQTKQKLRSARSSEVSSKGVKLQPEGQTPDPLEIPGSVGNEVQTPPMPLRSRRPDQKDSNGSSASLIQKKTAEPTEDRVESGDDGSSSSLNRSRRMPLRRESVKAELFPESVTESQPADSKKLSLRSQKSVALSTGALTDAARQINVASAVKAMPEKTHKVQVKSPPTPAPRNPPASATSSKHVASKHAPNKFFEMLSGEKGQQLVSNLNTKYDKIHKGWVQMDKDGQPAVRYRNKADRQAAIWKSKRRVRKPKSMEHQRYSPVQMLFMKGFDLPSICRWFLESTETQSLVIVKKVNTRLPSETQLCFHGSSSSSGVPEGIFPSIQAERLKKHLKKFAITSPVKSNAKSKKLIAKALEQEVNVVKGKEKAELSNNTQTPALRPCSSAKARAQIGDPQKPPGKSKNPASARILRKYSNIREKMQVQQSVSRLKGAKKIIPSKCSKTPSSEKSPAKTSVKQSAKEGKSAECAVKQAKESTSKLDKRKTPPEKELEKSPSQERAVKAQGSSRPAREPTSPGQPKRFSQRLGSSREPEQNPGSSPKTKVDTKKIDADNVEVEKTLPSKVMSVKMQAKESPQSPAADLKVKDSVPDPPQEITDVKAPVISDQVLTRSQKRMEAAAPPTPSSSSKKAAKPTVPKPPSPRGVKKVDESALTRSGASTRRQAALLSPTASKVGAKRPPELSETPAKRTRTK